MTIDDKVRRHKLLGDRALTEIETDEFGLGKLVDHISRAIGTRFTGDGYAIGLEGRWGSGKSTLVNFIAKKLETAKNTHVVRFEPWLTGDKASLLISFFAQLAESLDKAAAQKTGLWHSWRRKRTFRLSKRVRQYAQTVAIGGSAIAGLATGQWWMPIAAAGTKGASDILGLWEASETIERKKQDIVDGLRELHGNDGKQFVVIVDDTDRLEPAEAVELLRLIRTVADFPAVTYIICFDATVLAGQVEAALGISNGRDYLEKIFQTTLHVPPQEPFALRRLIKRRFENEFPEQMAFRENDRDGEYRRHLLFDQWCNVLVHTPRDAARLFDTVTLSWPYVPPTADFYDFVWLHLLKLKCPGLYLWVQHYVQNVAAFRDNGRPGDSGAKDAKELIKHLEKLGWGDRGYLSGVDHFLPGVSSAFISSDERRTVYDFSNRNELKTFEQNKRLGSPTHWRMYFAFDIPSYSVSDEEISLFRQNAGSNLEHAVATAMAMLMRNHDKPGHFFDVLLDRLSDLPLETFDDSEKTGLLNIFLAMMDDVDSVTREFKNKGRSEIWDKSIEVLRKTRPNSDFLRAIVAGKSLNWIAFVLREQGFAHGKNNHRSYPEAKWMTAEELDQAIERLSRRVEATPLNEILAAPHPMDILFFCEQLGDRDSIRKKVSEGIEEDDTFLSMLQSLRGWSSGSRDGIRHPLRASYVSFFTDAEVAHERLQSLANSQGSLSTKAREILKEWNTDLAPFSDAVESNALKS